VGYGVVIGRCQERCSAQGFLLFTANRVIPGVGFFFTFMMMGLTWVQNRYSRFDTNTSEEFNTASRSVKPGLIAAGIVSAWTWAATLLQSATVGYRYGVAGNRNESLHSKPVC
jgi:hypothetical protein